MNNTNNFHIFKMARLVSVTDYYHCRLNKQREICHFMIITSCSEMKRSWESWKYKISVGKLQNSLDTTACFSFVCPTWRPSLLHQCSASPWRCEQRPLGCSGGPVAHGSCCPSLWRFHRPVQLPHTWITQQTSLGMCTIKPSIFWSSAYEGWHSRESNRCHLCPVSYSTLSQWTYVSGQSVFLVCYAMKCLVLQRNI